MGSCDRKRFVVVGGGVGAVVCLQELCRLAPDAQVTIVSASSVLKGVATVIRHSEVLEEITIKEADLSEFDLPNAKIVIGHATGIDLADRRLLLAGGRSIPYDRLCVATGARPRRDGDAGSGNILTLRDTDSVETLASRLHQARRVVLVGNGGVALELVGAMQEMEGAPDLVWAVRKGAIGSALFDSDAARYLLGHVAGARVFSGEQVPGACAAPPAVAPERCGASCVVARNAPVASRADASVERAGSRVAAPTTSDTPASADMGAGAHLEARGKMATHGAAVGPRMGALLSEAARRHQGPTGSPRGQGQVSLAWECEVSSIREVAEGDWQVEVELTNGARHGADLVVLATGVVPNVEWVPPEVVRASDGGLAVDTTFETNVPGIYAVGDACTVNDGGVNKQWFQMRLWTQARHMGIAAAQQMTEAADDISMGLSLEIFTHVTRFFGRKVILLGLYNGQGLEDEPESDVITYSRSSPGPEGHFVRVLLLRGRMQGAVLIGETDLEETFENLILDGLDLSHYGPHLLDPDVELDHVFD